MEMKQSIIRKFHNNLNGKGGPLIQRTFGAYVVYN